MVSTQELQQLMEASTKDPGVEPAFFRALLDATIYVHTPLSDPSERLHLVMFKSPDDGELVIPVFTDEGKAEFAARGNVRIVAMSGRALLDLTRGAAVIINPNDVRCTLYPEEIRALLDDGMIAPVQKHEPDGDDPQCFKLDSVPRVLTRALKKSLSGIRGVEVAYVVGLRWPQAGYPDSLLIVLGGRADRAERDVRAVATALYDVIRDVDRPVDVTHFDCRMPPPAWIKDLGVKSVYRHQSSTSAELPSQYN